MMDRRSRPEIAEVVRFETAFVIGVDFANTRSREGMPLFVDWGANQCVERRHNALGSLDDFGFGLQELDEHITSVFVNREHDVAESSDREHEFFDCP